MQGDYIPSDNGVTGSEPEFSPTPPGIPTPEDHAPEAFTPPFTFDDSDLLQFQRDDGPYLDIYTDAIYRSLICCTDPETGWSFPPMDSLVYLSKMKPTAVRKHVKILCDELDKFTKVERSSENGSEANAYYLNAFSHGLVPSPMNPPTDDPLGEARRMVAQQRLGALTAQKDYELETKDLHIEQLKAQLEALGVPPVPPSEPADPPSREPPLRANPPLPPEEPPPPQFPEVDQWVAENWERLKAGGIKSYVGYREWLRKHPHEIEIQAEKWRAADQAEERAAQGNRRNPPEDLTVPVWDGPPPDPEAGQLWSTVLDNLRAKLPRPTFETWLKPTTGMAIDPGDVDVLVVGAPTPFAVEWLERRMFHALQTELQKVADKSLDLRFTVRGPMAEDESTEGGDSDSRQGGD